MVGAVNPLILRWFSLASRRNDLPLRCHAHCDHVMYDWCKCHAFQTRWLLLCPNPICAYLGKDATYGLEDETADVELPCETANAKLSLFCTGAVQEPLSSPLEIKQKVQHPLEGWYHRGYSGVRCAPSILHFDSLRQIGVEQVSQMV